MIVVQGTCVSPAVEERLGVKLAQPYYAIGFLRDNGNLLSVFVFNNYNKSNVDLTLVAEPGGVTRGVMRVVADYVFNQLGCRRATAYARINNKQSIKACKRVGFVFECIAEAHYPDSDAVQFKMTKEACPWLAHPNRLTLTPLPERRSA